MREANPSGYKELYDQLLQTNRKAYGEAEEHGEITEEAYDDLRERVEEIYRKIPDSRRGIRSFAQFVCEQDGHETIPHATNTALYKGALLKLLRQRDMPVLEHRTRQEDIEAITGMALHDVGKKRLNNNLINEAKNLTDEDFEKIKDHTDLGHQALPEKASKPARHIVANHHERPDGEGYNGKEELNIYEQISGVIDVFDALHADRHYHEEQRNAGEAVDIVEEEFGKHDEVRPVLDAFYDTVTAYPSGQLVRLDNGVVVQVNDPEQQRAHAILDENNAVPGQFELRPGEVHKSVEPSRLNPAEARKLRGKLEQMRSPAMKREVHSEIRSS